MLKETIKNEIKNKLKDVEIKIFSNDDKYFNAIIISNVFDNQSLIERQKTIHEIIGKYIINKDIHAISFKTYTNAEWTQENQN